LALAFTVGALLALLPCVPFIAAGPEQFVFGNFEYPALNTAYRLATHYDTATSPLEKIVYVFANILVRPGNAALLLLLVFTAMLSCQWRSFDPQRRFQIASLIILIEALLISAFAPSPLFVPYFYSPVVLLLLLV